MSKVGNFNKYFQKIFLILVLLSLSLIPWIEFINANLGELDFIFNDNLVVLLILYFLFVLLIYLILDFLTYLERYSLVSFITISIWIFFQHSFLKSSINAFSKKISISNEYSSEVALILIIPLIYLFLFLIKEKKIYTSFFLIFLIFNLFFSTIQFTTKFFSQKKNINFAEYSNDNLINNIKRPNIYFFILDAMMPLNEFKNYYKKDLSNF